MHVLKKQAIYDRQNNIAFWEIFLQDKNTGRYPEDLDPLKATVRVIDTLIEWDPYVVGGGKLIFVNVPAIFLEASMFDLIPAEYVGIELVENKHITNSTYEAINLLLKRGFKFCIDDFGFERIDYLPMLSKAHFVKIDLKNNSYNMDELKEVISILRSLKKGIIVKNVETEEDYKRAKELGFEYFQGFYLSKPALLKDAKNIQYLKGTLLKLYKAISEQDLKQVVRVLESDVGATYKLMKFANSAFFPKLRKISKLEEAVVHLGFDNIAKFAIVLALSEMFAKDEDKGYWEKALYRACLMEKLAEIYSPNLKGKAHMVGLFSLSREILGRRPEDVASELGLDKDIQDAFERKNNELSFMLSLVELLEDVADPQTIEKVAGILGTTTEKIQSILEEADKESKIIARAF